MSKMTVVASGLLLMLSYGCSSYRYSVRVQSYPQKPMRLGDFSVQSCEIENDDAYPMRLVKKDALYQALGESDHSRKECPPITLKLKSGKCDTRGRGADVFLNFISLGILPINKETSADIHVSVTENGKPNPERNFTLRLEKRERFTPLGLWPFILEDHNGKCYSVGVGIDEKWTSPENAFNEVLGWGLLSGLTTDFK